jgi:hypothetical protein
MSKHEPVYINGGDENDQVSDAYVIINTELPRFA